jgi:SNF2 family DNA or RNA helicase
MEMQDKDSNQILRTSSSSEATGSNEDSTQQHLKDLIERINTQSITEGQGAKLDSIIRHIKYIKTSSNGKCVVFSQWSKVLDMLKAGLTTNGIQCVTLSGGVNKSNVSKFQNDPNINVILLHARSQSSGLTLVSAHTVFIVEPVFNESLEKQAINRVHRIGQTKQVNYQVPF